MAGSIKIFVDDDNHFFDEDVSIRLVKCGRERCLSDKKEEGGGDRIYCSLHYVLKGEGYLVVNGEKHKVEKGNVFLIRANEDIRYCQDKFNPWTFIWADFIGDNLESIFMKCGLEKSVHYLKPKTPEVLEWFVQMLDAHFERGLLLESTIVLSRILIRLMEENAKNYPITMNRIVREAIIFMNNNYRIEISLAVLAESVGVSPNYLANIFSSEIGLSPMKYLMLFRIANACEQIRENTCNLKEISYRVGYKDQLYFSRCFSAIKGVPPRDYLKKCSEDDPWQFIKTSNLDFDDRKGKYV